MEDFIVLLNFRGDDYSVKIEDPTNTITVIIDKLVNEMQLSKVDSENNPIRYFLGMSNDGKDVIFQPTNNGKEQTLEDYNVAIGDRLTLMSEIIPG